MVRRALFAALAAVAGVALVASASSHAADAVKPAKTDAPNAPAAAPARHDADTKGVKDAKDIKDDKASKTTADGIPPDAEGRPEGEADETKAPRHAKTSHVAKPKHHGSSSDGKSAAGDGANVAEGSSPASPPPLTMSGLRDEMRREGAAAAIDPQAAPHTKLEQMLAEIAKTREALHQDTARLEALATADSAEPAAGATSAGAGAAEGGGGTPRPAAKNPLDVLAKALRAIKPEQAAPIVARLDKGLAATVLQRMPPGDAGKIMGALKPETAAELATQIAMRTPSTLSEVKR